MKEVYGIDSDWIKKVSVETFLQLAFICHKVCPINVYARESGCS